MALASGLGSHRQTRGELIGEPIGWSVSGDRQPGGLTHAVPVLFPTQAREVRLQGLLGQRPQVAEGSQSHHAPSVERSLSVTVTSKQSTWALMYPNVHQL